jgi:hypothetical protein
VEDVADGDEAVSEQRIAYPNNVIMAIAWRDGLTWAFSERDLLAKFESDTGVRIPRERSAIEAMVDRACGVEHASPSAIADAFVEWFNKEIWGEDPFAERCECGRTPHLRVCPDHPANEAEVR